MRMPPTEVLRTQSLPDDAVVVVRGGEHSLDNANLERSVAAGDLAELARLTPLARRRLIRIAYVGDLRRAGFEVVPTFKNPYHFSIVLPNAVAPTFAKVRACFTPPVPNPGYEPVQDLPSPHEA
jgi:hypothetical protein